MRRQVRNVHDKSARGHEKGTHAGTHAADGRKATMYQKKPRSLTLVLDSFVPSARVMDREKMHVREQPSHRLTTCVRVAMLTIVNGLARRALLIVPLASGKHFEKKAARATSKKFRRITSVKLPCFIMTSRNPFNPKVVSRLKLRDLNNYYLLNWPRRGVFETTWRSKFQALKFLFLGQFLIFHADLILKAIKCKSI